MSFDRRNNALVRNAQMANSRPTRIVGTEPPAARGVFGKAGRMESLGSATPIYSRSGNLLYSRSGNLRVQTFDVTGNRLKLFLEVTQTRPLLGDDILGCA